MKITLPASKKVENLLTELAKELGIPADIKEEEYCTIIFTLGGVLIETDEDNVPELLM